MCNKTVEMQYRVCWQNKLTEETGFCVGEFPKEQAEQMAEKLNEEKTVYIHFITPWSCKLTNGVKNDNI